MNALNSGIAFANRRIDTANAGVALGLAMNAVPMALNVGEQGITGGVGTFEGRQAIGFRYSAQPTTKVTLGLGVGVGFANDTSVGASAGVGFKF